MNTVIAKQLAEYKHKIMGLGASGDPPKKDETMNTTTTHRGRGTPKGHKPNRITLETKDAILHWYKQGYNGVQIGQKLGIPASVASYHITKYRKLGFKRDLADTKHVEPKKPTTPTQEMRHRGDTRPYQQRITTEKLDLIQTIAKLEAKVEVLKEMLKEERELNSRTRNR
jgi:hypothetical protein